MKSQIALGAGIGMIFGAAFGAPGPGLVIGAALGIAGVLGPRGRDPEPDRHD